MSIFSEPTVDFECGKCEECPRIKHLFDDVHARKHLSIHVADEVMSHELDELSPLMFNMFKELPGGLRGLDGELIDTPEEFATFIRKAGGEVLNNLDEAADETLDIAEGLVDGCPGPLKMRANKGGRQIMAVVCASPSMPEGFTCDEVHVTRTTLPSEN